MVNDKYGRLGTLVLSQCREWDEMNKEQFRIVLRSWLKDAIYGNSVAVDRMMQAEPTDVYAFGPIHSAQVAHVGANVRWKPR
jgi:hypothetical protein